MDIIDTPINKVVAVVIVAGVAPTAMIAFNTMNTTGFTTEQIAITGIMGLLVAFSFLKIIMKD